MTLQEDDLRRNEGVRDDLGTEASAPDAGMSDDEQAEAAEIRADIEETRSEMGGTLNELGDRLDPAHIVEQAKENVREATIGRVEETAKGMSDMVIETIKRNPIPAALAGAGLAMLWTNRTTGDTHQAQNGRYNGYGQDQTDLAGTARGAVTSVGDAASALGQNVGGAVGSVGEGAQQTAGEVVERGRQTVEAVGGRLDRFMQANPMAVGAIAIGAGALVGSILPETPQEREMLGDASRQLGNVVRESVDKAATKAEETIDTVEEKVAAPA